MNIRNKRRWISRAMLGRLATALVLASVVGGIAAAPARADDDDWRGHRREEWREHHRREEWRERQEWRERHRVFVAPPAYVYAPPPVVYAPPPSGINLVFPIEIH